MLPRRGEVGASSGGTAGLFGWMSGRLHSLETMARDIRPGEWPVELSDEDITSRVGGRAFLRGRSYALQGRVRDLSVAGDGDIISAQVMGSGRRVYQTMILRKPGSRVWVGNCSCPVGMNCKHSAAALLTARALAEEDESSPQAGGAASAWEWQLNRLLSTGSPAGYRRMALEITDQRTMGGLDDGLAMVPLIEGKRGWNRQGASWDRIYNGTLDAEVDAAVLEALRELGSISEDLFHYSDRISLMRSPVRVWDALRRARAAGLTLTTAQRNGAAVRIVPGLEVGVALHHDAQGEDLIISPVVKYQGIAELDALEAVPDLVSLGEPVHGYYSRLPTGELLLMPLDPPPGPVLARMLADVEQVIIPAEDVERFEASHLEAVTRSLPVLVNETAVSLPEPAQARLVLGVHVDPEGHRLATDWSVRYVTASGKERGRYKAGELGELAASAGGPHAPGAQAPSAARDRATEARLAREAFNAMLPLLEEHGAVWQPQRLSGMDTARFMMRTLPALEELDCFEVEVDGSVPDYRESEHVPLITTEVKDDQERPDWFSLQIRVKVGQEEIPIPQLMAALAAGQQEILLDSGAWVSLERPEIQSLARLMEEGRELEEAPGSLRVTSLQAGYYQELEALGVVSQASRRWKERVGRLLEQTAAAEAAASGGSGGDTAGAAGGGDGGRAGAGAPPPQGMRAELRPYQLEGYRWLDMLRSAGLGGVLADDMGLGKTVQVLAAIQRMKEEPGRARPGEQAGPADGADGAGVPGQGHGEGLPVLVIAPTSVVGSWAEQAERFCPDLRVRPVTRTAAKREQTLAEITAGADLVVTSYTIVRLCEEEFVDQEWDWVVCDEAQFVKNHTSATYKAVRRLRSPSTIAITGTPLENSLMDLWSLLSISAPGLLPAPERFGQVYRKPIDRGDLEALGRLRRRMRPFMLRRTKEQVAAELPAKTEQVLSIDLDARHRRAYDQRLSRERQRILGLLEEDTAQARFSALKALTTLRQMALDPALVEGATASGRSSGKRRATAKVSALLERLEPILTEGHRALVFSQFTRYLTGVREHLEAQGVRTVYLDGATSNRQAVIDDFRAGQADVFLISLKAGGFGLTLTEADYVFLLDPWWNPQTEEQAVDRTHRIGQDKPVMVYRMVSADTIEEKVMALKEKKAELFGRVVDGSADSPQEAALTGAAGSPAALTAAEIRSLIED